MADPYAVRIMLAAPAMYRLIIVTFLSLILASCSMSGSADRAMQRAESLMESHPDSALAVMRQIDSSRLHGKRESALYALLLTQAQYKNYIAVTDDSLISTAVDYFDRTDDLYHQMLAYHYCGQVNYDTKNYINALFSSLVAYQLAIELDEKFWIAMSARTLADIYHDTYNGYEALTYSEIELDNFRIINKQPHINYAIDDIIASNILIGKYDEALVLSKQLLDSSKISNDSNLQVVSMRDIGLAYLNMKKFEEAALIYNQICSLSDAEASDSLYYLYTYIGKGEIDSAKIWLKQCNDVSSGLGSWMKYEIYEALDSMPQAMLELKKMNIHTDSVLRHISVQNVSGTVTEFFDYRNGINEAELKTTRVIMLFSAVFVVIIFVLVGAYVIHSRRKQEEKINKNIEIAENLREMIAINNKDAQKRIHNLLADRFDFLDNLCQILYEKNNSVVARKQVSKEIDSLIEQLSKDEKKLHELSEYIDIHYDGIMTKLKADFPDMLDMDYRLFLYSILGFSNSAIAMFLGEEKITAVYARRKRLKNKIKAKCVKNGDEYIGALQ